MAVLDEGGHEVVSRDACRREHEVITSTSINDIAHDRTVWLAARHVPGRPTRQITDF
ncbi:hypothetical protein [Streptomyces sp. NPDC058086]|uniref:hypothetical protein n=1 Tax=Streptomyces sp. NPDC058086 TaxID=3346334 RepID=UPI0036E10568